MHLERHHLEGRKVALEEGLPMVVKRKYNKSDMIILTIVRAIYTYNRESQLRAF